MDVHIERALIIKPEPMQKILDGKKTWEYRSQKTNIRGLVALIQSGSARVVGACQVVDCLGPLTVDEFIQNASKGGWTRKKLEADRAELELEFAERNLYAWVLKNVVAFSRGFAFQNPAGAVTWASLPRDVARRVEKAVQDHLT